MPRISRPSRANLAFDRFKSLYRAQQQILELFPFNACQHFQPAIPAVGKRFHIRYGFFQTLEPIIDILNLKFSKRGFFCQIKKIGSQPFVTKTPETVLRNT